MEWWRPLWNCLSCDYFYSAFRISYLVHRSNYWVSIIIRMHVFVSFCQFLKKRKKKGTFLFEKKKNVSLPFSNDEPEIHFHYILIVLMFSISLLLCQWDLEYVNCIPAILSKGCVLGMTQLYVMVKLEDLGSVKYSFIAIIPSSILTQIDKTC